jgi:hypothetical protein
MSPPELMELTPCLYSCKLRIASRELENIRNPQSADLLLAVNRLLDEECLAKLVPADKRLHRAETVEEFLDFAVLENLL